MSRDDETTRHEGGKHEGPAHTSPYPLSRLAPPHDLIDVARRIAEADAMIAATTSARLQLIAAQIQALQDQARRILEQAKEDLELHRAHCGFARRPGGIYHLYRRANGELWWSMVAPGEWGDSPPAAYVGSYRLEPDQRWTRIGEDEEREPIRPELLVRRLLGEG